MKDQLPAEGCTTCGAYAGEPQHVLRKRLELSGVSWLCKECIREEESEQMPVAG